MNHPDLQQWVERARGMLGGAELEAVEAHLAAGCERCRRSAEVMTTMAELASREREYVVPAASEAEAVRLFPRRERPRAAERLTLLGARLVYDSMRDPLPVGVRADNRVGQVLYLAGQYAVDLQVNREKGRRESASPRLIIVGQVANRDEPEKRLSGLQVLLLSGRVVAAHTLSNELGEFHLECEARERLRLQVCVDVQRTIEVPVGSVATDQG